jgi:4-hydroxybenzoate polyprenyltransferase
VKLVSTIYAFLGLMRPIEWSKSLGNMVLAVLTVAMLFPTIQLDLTLFLHGFASIALLWSGLYALNDYTDWKQDKLHPVKKIRAIPSGRVSPNSALGFSLLLIILSLILAFWLNALIMIAWFAMLINQLLYTLKPFNFKKRPVLDLISGSLINPIFRFYYGWLLFIPAFDAPISVLAFIMGVQFGGYGLYRFMSRDQEKKFNISSSVVVFGTTAIKRLFYFSFFVGGVGYIVSSLTIWKMGHLVFGILAFIVLIKIFYKTLKNPSTEKMKTSYWISYASYLIFIAGFAAITFIY